MNRIGALHDHHSSLLCILCYRTISLRCATLVELVFTRMYIIMMILLSGVACMLFSVEVDTLALKCIGQLLCVPEEAFCELLALQLDYAGHPLKAYDKADRQRTSTQAHILSPLNMSLRDSCTAQLISWLRHSNQQVITGHFITPCLISCVPST